MSQEIEVAHIAATPPTVAALLGYLANRRSLRRSVGTNQGVPLTKVLEPAGDQIRITRTGRDRSERIHNDGFGAALFAPTRAITTPTTGARPRP